MSAATASVAVAPTSDAPGLARALALAAAIVLAPIAALLWLALNPSWDVRVILPTDHFFIVTMVSILAALVALTVARSAMQLAQYQVLLMTLGFVCVAGFFSVHAVATPGMTRLGSYGVHVTTTGHGSTGAPTPPPGAPGASSAAVYPTDASSPMLEGVEYGATVAGLSGFLSVFISSFFFAASYAPVAYAIRRRLSLPAGALMLLVLAMVALYGFLAGWETEFLLAIPLTRPPWTQVFAAITVLVLGFAAWHQARDYARTRFPMHWAMAVAFVLLAEAQVTMINVPFWSLSWWGYHVQIGAAVVLALGSVFLELDRRRGLERFLPAQVVERVVAGDLLRLGGDRKVVTILFADLRGSTALAETLSPAQTVALLNTYVGAFAHGVFARDGMLDKFLGDGVMAIFGVLPDGTDGAAAAVGAALEIRRSVGEINRERAGRGEPTLGFGVGIHTGPVILGAIGLPQRSDYTAIGDAVNTASRLQGLCKEYQVDLVLSRDTADRLPPGTASLRELGSAEVRGKRDSVPVLTIA